MFHISDPKDIKSGRTTDVYFARTVGILKKKGIDKWVRKLRDNTSSILRLKMVIIPIYTALCEIYG